MKTFYDHHGDPGRGGTSYLMRIDFGLTEVFNPDKADLIIFNGGEDIATSIYGVKPISKYIPETLSMRDEQEIALFRKYSKDPTKLIFGICRGAQLLNCLNGGKLYQDVDGHGRPHQYVDLRTGVSLEITSTHHQQMRPGPAGEVIGIASQSRYKNSELGVQHFTPVGLASIDKGEDVETVWYKDTRTLCMQGHPEYVPGSKYAKYTWALLNECWDEIKLQKAIRA